MTTATVSVLVSDLCGVPMTCLIYVTRGSVQR